MFLTSSVYAFNQKCVRVCQSILPILWLLPESLNSFLQRGVLSQPSVSCHFHCTKSSRNLWLFLTMEMITLLLSFNWCRLVSIFIFLWSFQETYNRMEIRPLDSSYQLSQYSRAEAETSFCFNHLTILILNN